MYRQACEVTQEDWYFSSVSAPVARTRVEQDLKAKILHFVIIPSFAAAFEKGEDERLIGGPPAPDQDNPDNIISVFINKVRRPSLKVLGNTNLALGRFSLVRQNDSWCSFVATGDRP